MNRIAAIVSLVLMVVATALLTAQTAAPLSPEALRKHTSDALAKAGERFDSVGTPLLIKNLVPKSADFYLIPVINDVKLVAVYRNDPRRGAVTEVASARVLKQTRGELFTRDGATRQLQSLLIENPDPIAISCGPLSAFGSLNAGWYQRTGDSFVLLSFGGKLITQTEVAEFWPEYLNVLREFRR